MESTASHTPRARVSTGVAGLDQVSVGGFFRGALYLVDGPPGSGKSTLAHQCCFAAAAGGRGSLYVSLYAEPQVDMLLNFGASSFFKQDSVSHHFRYLGGLSALLDGGLSGLLRLIAAEVATSRPEVVVVDGLESLEMAETESRSLQRHLMELKALARLTDCVVIVLATDLAGRVNRQAAMLADGVVMLLDAEAGRRRERAVEMTKFRGASVLRGEHAMRIDADGLTVFPRIEALYVDARPMGRPETDMSTGIELLDRMLGGGFPAASAVVVVGPSGVGKTVLGLQFLSQSSARSPGVFFGCFESPERLAQKASRLGLPLPEQLEIVWYSQGERMLDELGAKLLAAVDRVGAKRLFLDGIDSLIVSSFDPSRIGRYLSVLANELRQRGVTTLMSSESAAHWDTDVSLPLRGSSAFAEVVLLMRLVDDSRRIRRSIAIGKYRDSPFDDRVHGFTIGQGGIRIPELLG